MLSISNKRGVQEDAEDEYILKEVTQNDSDTRIND